MNSMTQQIAKLTIGIVWLLSACGPELPNDVHVDVSKPVVKEITMTQLQAADSGNTILPPFYEQTPGTKLESVVIPFDVRSLPEGVNYNVVTVMVNIVKDVGESGYPENEDVNVVTTIPANVDRVTDKTESTKIAASITATIKIFMGTLGVEQSGSETYQRFYRSVAAHITAHRTIYWEFKPFLDEPILPGTYYVVAVVEVPTGSMGNLLFISAGCSYASSTDSNGCTAGATQKVYLP